MAYYNNIAEDNFQKEAIKRGYKVKKSDSQSDMYKHIDFYMSSEDSPPFSVDVKGLGSLMLEKRHLITSYSGGKVVEVLVKPGEFVKQGQIIAKLENHELTERITQLRNTLLKTKALHKSALIEQQAHLSEAETAFYEAELAHKANEIQWQAQSTLIAQGNSTISKLDHQKSKFAVKRSQRQVEFHQVKISAQKEILAAREQAQQAETVSIDTEIAMLEKNIEQLAVRAPITGQIQDVYLDLGMRLSSGSSIAEIADHQQLIAKIDIPELDAPHIEVGQSALIDTYSSQLDAKVTRVSPKVINGHVEVELSLIDTLPIEARDKLNIEGVINTSIKQNTLFVAIPRNAIANNINSVFVVDSHLATKKRVNFGNRSVNHVEVLAGLLPDQTIIISDMEKFVNDQQVLIR